VGTRRDQVGESPAWDPRGERLLWVDLFAGRVNELRCEDGDWRDGEGFQLDKSVGTAIPCAGGGLLLTAGTEFIHRTDDGGMTRLGAVEVGHPAARFNDAKCDPRGRLLASWMVEGKESIWGGVCRLDPDGSITTLLDDVGLVNGLGWSPDGRTLYLVDTLKRRIDAFDYDLETGTVSERRPFLCITEGEGGPDGMTVDEEGCLWVAVLFDGAVRRYSSSGELIEAVDVPTRMVTSVTFGGPRREDMFITSLSIDLPATLIGAANVRPDTLEKVEHDEHKGHLFVCRPGIVGSPTTPFALQQ
jgi:sugar lactone lactonase YvrE